jgi:hypothetical protein
MKTILLSSCVLLLFLAACAAGPSQPRDPGAAQSCEALKVSAAAIVAQAVASHAACSTDADCVTVGFGASCFDHCTRAMNVSGKADLEAAQTRVDGAQCRQFQERGCKSFAPPCMAPAPPTCKAGACI